jgi:hypothetical protein
VTAARLWPALALLACTCVTGTALARVERFAVIIGNNEGSTTDSPLRYAQADAQRIYDVLHDLGGFEPVNMVLLRNERADTVLSTLIAINDRIRQAITVPETQAVLMVYYSGHADAEALHLRGTALPIVELARLASGSAASFRLVVLDACRSGSLTRAKGGRVTEPFALAEERLLGDGLAYLTASSAQEDAQESDVLRGSFFTHALVSGLLGAADRDGDGEVVLDEAYRYAYDATLRATSRTFAGLQHPTFRYDLRGHSDVVLTRPEAYAAQRANVALPRGYGFLFMREHADGAVAAELLEREAQRTLSLRPGRYFVRARAPDVLYEGAIELHAGDKTLSLDGLERIDYAHLVRKGGRSSRLSHGPELGAQLRSPLVNASTVCAGGYAGYSLDLEALSIGARASACTSQLEGAGLSATVNAYDLSLRVKRVWDFASWSLGAGLGGGMSMWTQAFATMGRAPGRQSAAPFLMLVAQASYDLTTGWSVVLEVAGETHFLRFQRDALSPEETAVGFAVRPSLGLGKSF